MPSSNNINVVHPGDSIEGQRSFAPRHRSKFNNSYINAFTARFGELTPHYAAEVVGSDHFNVRCPHKILTTSLKAPFMSQISVKKDYFAVPKQAILPFQWDRIFTQPNLGDDVPIDAYCNVNLNDNLVANFFSPILDNIDYYYQNLFDEEEQLVSDNFIGLANWIFRFFIGGEYFFSRGSLLSILGCSLSQYIYFVDGDSVKRDFDYTFDRFISSLFPDDNYYFVAKFGDRTYNVCLNPVFDYGSDPSTDISLRRFLELARDNGYFEITYWSNLDSSSTYSDFLHFVEETFQDSTPLISANIPDIDLSYLHAYQIVCAHYYSNDSVDYIYSAELYRQNIMSLFEKAFSEPASFDWNGIRLPYDYCSAFIFNTLNSNFNDYPEYFLSYLGLVFAFRHSLRFVDYFTGSKTRPLAVGNTDVAVNNDSVSVIDVTKNILWQRFLNAVNRTGRKIASYGNMLTGAKRPQDYHDPMFLGHTMDYLGSDETQNTAEGQLTLPNNVTSVLKNNSSKFAFEFDSEFECVVIGITYFDIPRLYANGIDRHFFWKDRFDMFNPFLENVGDQPVYEQELQNVVWDSTPLEAIFGYQQRYMEFKTRVNRVAGGLVNYLPAYAFIADNANGFHDLSGKVSPSYIRSSNVELDDFFVSLTGYSLASYFHFIIFNDIQDIDIRPMQTSAQIL